ncbi:MAG TPA: NAD(P)H-hydrate dehydratase [Cyclobacteriaceae bacterium]|nr:NAD(P)H-hydrate dehydratase [Cyclobacteriaceae bacterium]
MEILNASQIRAWDAYTIATEPVASIDLMERACNAFVNWFVARFDRNEKVGVVCGTGNNGGDGLGIARLLTDKKFSVRLFIIDGKNQSEDFKKNYARLPKEIAVFQLEDVLSSSSVLIDAIFGSGLSRPVEGIYAEVIRKINASKATKVAVDVPSGLRLDEPSSGEIIEAQYTITFQAPKLPFMFPQYARNVEEWHVVDIGLSGNFFGDESMRIDTFYVDEASVRAKLRPRRKFSHKGDYGRALIIAGSHGKMGACVLAAKAALRSGAGLLTVHVPGCGYTIIQTSVPEAMASVDVEEDHFSDAGETKNYTVIGVGPGLGVTSSTTSGLRKILESGKPCVLDADALNIISQNRGFLHLLPAGSILTPHPGEFERLVGEWPDDFARLDLQRKLAAQTKCVVVLKGAHTSIATPGSSVFFNSTGNPGMAKGGSGDVLTGVLTGLLSQGYSASDAAIIGVYIHGHAADLAASRTGQTSLLAGDIVEFLGQSFDR